MIFFSLVLCCLPLLFIAIHQDFYEVDYDKEAITFGFNDNIFQFMTKIECLTMCTSQNTCLTVAYNFITKSCQHLNYSLAPSQTKLLLKSNLYRKKVSFNQNCEFVDCIPSFALVCDSNGSICKCSIGFGWNDLNKTCEEQTSIQERNLTNCDLFACSSTSECKSGVSCSNGRCDGMGQYNLTCELGGTIIINDGILTSYYIPYPAGTAYNWNQAGSFCQSRGGYLLKIDDNYELDFMRSVLRSIKANDAYHRWINDSCTAWSASNPDANPYIANLPCSDTQQVICEF